MKSATRMKMLDWTNEVEQATCHPWKPSQTIKSVEFGSLMSLFLFVNVQWQEHTSSCVIWPTARCCLCGSSGEYMLFIKPCVSPAHLSREPIREETFHSWHTNCVRDQWQQGEFFCLFTTAKAAKVTSLLSLNSSQHLSFPNLCFSHQPSQGWNLGNYLLLVPLWDIYCAFLRTR